MSSSSEHENEDVSVDDCKKDLDVPEECTIQPHLQVLIYRYKPQFDVKHKLSEYDRIWNTILNELGWIK